MDCMGELYGLGYNRAKQGYPCERTPPALYVGPERQ